MVSEVPKDPQALVALMVPVRRVRLEPAVRDREPSPEPAEA